MRTMEKLCAAMMWVLLTISSLFTAVATVSVYVNKSNSVYSPTLLLISTGLMLVAAIVYTAMPRGKVIPLVVSVLAAPLVVIATVKLGEAFPENADLFREVGLTAWELVYRHYSMLGVPLCMFASFMSYRVRVREEKQLAEAGYQSIYDLSGDPLFEDASSNDTPTPKKKRSVAARERKAKQQ